MVSDTWILKGVGLVVIASLRPPRQLVNVQCQLKSVVCRKVGWMRSSHYYYLRQPISYESQGIDYISSGIRKGASETK